MPINTILIPCKVIIVVDDTVSPFTLIDEL